MNIYSCNYLKNKMFHILKIFSLQSKGKEVEKSQTSGNLFVILPLKKSSIYY